MTLEEALTEFERLFREEKDEDKRLVLTEKWRPILENLIAASKKKE